MSDSQTRIRNRFSRGLLASCLISLVLPFASGVQGASPAAKTTAAGPALTQGSLYIGHTAAGNTVTYNDQPVMVSADGLFILGFGRDAELTQRYIIKDSKGKSTTHTLQLAPREYEIQRITGVESKYVTPPQSRLDRIKDDNRQIGEARAIWSKTPHFTEGLVRPSIGRLTGVYGSQRYFNGQPRNPHYGLDYAAPTGTPVVAPASGTVTLAHPDMYFSGGTIIIDHGMGLNTSFLHLSKLDVKVGDAVVQGQKIGEVGATGRVTGAHLDWRANWGSVRLDPALVMEALPVPGQKSGD